MIFDDEIRNDVWTLFHGTSSFWEPQIDANGLKIHHHPVNLDEVRSVLHIYENINYLYYDSPINFIIAYSLVGLTDAPSICLSSVPELAASYSKKSNAGGEVVMTVRQCIKALKKFIRSRVVRGENLLIQLEAHVIDKKRGIHRSVIEPNIKWIKERLSMLTPLEERLNKISQSHRYGLVYAFRFEAGDEQFLSGGDAVILAKKSIPAAKIIAKARIHGTKWDHLDCYPDRAYRDRDNDKTLMGLIANKEKRNSLLPRIEAHAPYDQEWKTTPIDSNAGRDLTLSMDIKSIINYLKSNYPVIPQQEIYN